MNFFMKKENSQLINENANNGRFLDKNSHEKVDTRHSENPEGIRDSRYKNAEMIFDALFEDEYEDSERSVKEEVNQEENGGENNEVNEEGKEGLTEEEKARIKEETGWSDEIINAIASMEEYEIYKKAGLVEAEVNHKKCLVRSDIDWNQKDAMGRTNKERAEQGLSPINKDGKVIELHHIGQHADSPLAELTAEEHRGKGNDTILHNKSKESEIDRNVFANEREIHWEARANEDEKIKENVGK